MSHPKSTFIIPICGVLRLLKYHTCCRMRFITLILLGSMVTNNAKAQSTILSNPSACALALPLADLTCPENLPFYNPDIFDLNVTGVAGTALGTDVYLSEVWLLVEHPWISDLNIQLRSPGGQTAVLVANAGGNADSFGDPSLPNCSGAMRFELAACTPITDGVAPFIDDSYRAQDDFFLFNDGVTNPNGIWQLLICDDLEDDVGTLEFVELRFSPLVCLPVTDLEVLNQDSTAVTLNYDTTPGCGAAIVEVGPPGFTPGSGATMGGGSQLFMVDCPPFALLDLPENTELDIYLRRSCLPNDFSANSCPLTISTGCQPAATTALEDFSDAVNCLPVCTDSCELTSNWRNAYYDDMNWLATDQATPTSGTGPNSGLGGAGTYVYIEANGSNCAAGAEAVLLGPCFTLDKQGTDSCHASFAFHMNGINIGSLRFEVSTDGGVTWDPLWSRSGSQGNRWQRAYVSLQSYTDGREMQLRFVGTKGNGVYGDIAIDDIRLHGSINTGFPTLLLYADQDGDGFGDPATAFPSCLLSAPDGFATNGDDCNDDAFHVNPAAEEDPCNGIDENCNAATIDDDSILPLPILVGDTICGGDTATLQAITAPDYTVFWYDTPDKSNGIIGVGATFNPTIPDPASPFQTVRTYYAEVTNFVCSSTTLVSAEVLVWPRPVALLEEEPAVCFGDTIDLAGLDIEDAQFTGALASFHGAWPPTEENELSATTIVVEAPSTVYFRLQSSDGCADIDSLIVDVRDQPELTFLPADSFSLCRFANDTVRAIPSGGAGDYQFEWSTGLTGDRQPVSGGNTPGELLMYNVTVTDQAMCSTVDTVLLTTTNSIDSLRISTTAVSTCNGTDGSIIVVPLNGLPPFAYQWQDESGSTGSGGGFNDSIFIDDLAQNAYRVTITDASASRCEVFLSGIRVQGPGFQLSDTDITSPTCAGFADGALCLDISGNTSPLTINWTTGDTTICIDSLATGTYGVTITNGDCTITESYTLLAPDSLQNIVRQSTPTCVGSTDGSLRITTIGGTPNYTYQWADNATVLSTRSNLGIGDYPLVVEDANGCILLDTISLLGPQPLTVDIDSVRSVSCSGLEDGLVRVRGLGGAPPYQYQWSDGSVAPLRTGLTFGSYPLTVTDFNGCVFTTVVFIAQPTPLELTLLDSTSPVCFGDETGSATLAINGGTGPYNIRWSDGLETTDVLRTNMGVGAVTAIVEDANGCLSDTLIVELAPLSTLSFTATLGEPSCVGLPDGSINLDVNGQEPISYLWSTGATTPNLTAVVADTYGLTITDGRGCEADTVFQLTAPQVFSINSTVVQPSCFGVDDGIIDQSFSATGTPPFQFFWNDDSQHVDQMFLGPGEYQFTVTDAVGCSFTSDIFMIRYPEPLIFADIQRGELACVGDTTGYFEVQLDGGTTPYSYNWVGSGNTSNARYGLGEGTYRLLVEDMRGCPLDTLLELLGPEPFSVMAQLTVGNVCDAGTNDILSASVEGGEGPFTYRWNTGDIGDRLTDPTPGDYIVSATDTEGCTASFGTIKVQDRVEPLVLDSFNVQQVSCFGAKDANLTAFTSGGSGQLRYHFTPTYIEETDADSVRIAGLPFDVSYSVTVTDLTTGCEVSSTLITGEQPDPLVVQRDSFQTVTCFNGDNGAIFTSVDGGTMPYQFAWTNDAGTPVAATQDLLNASPGIYQLLVTDANNCEAMLSDTNIVSVGLPILLTDTSFTAVICRGGSTGAIDVMVEGGRPPYDYRWSNGEIVEDLVDVIADNYALTVTDTDDCEVVFSNLSITEPASNILISSQVDSISCAGGENGQVTLQTIGGVGPPYEFRWRRNGILLPSIQGAVATDLGAAIYTVAVRDTNECEQIIEVELLDPTELTLDIINSPLGVDSLEVLVSGGQAPYDYRWSNGDTTSTANDLSDGNYTVTVTDANDCTETASFVLTSVNQIEQLSQQYELSPNPTNGILRLRRKDGYPLSPFAWRVYSVAGQTIRQGQVKGLTAFWEDTVAALPPGTYWLWVRFEDEGVIRMPFVVY